jgi:hypothetical protein
MWIFPPRIKLICPTGKKIVARENLSTPPRKNIPLRDCPKSNLQFHCPGPQEGRIAIVTDVGQGMRWTRSVRRNFFARTSDAAAYGEVVWSWRRGAGVKLLRVQPRVATVAKEPFTGESTK